MDATRTIRVFRLREDGDESGWCVAFVPIEESWPDWKCEHCRTDNVGEWLNCAYCGQWREDIDECI